jgi:hypothetical protein
MNVRQNNGVNRAVKWMSIHFTALFTPLYCLTFILLLCLPHCIVWHSFYSSVYLIILSDIHFTDLFTPLYCLTFTLPLCLTIQWGKQSSKMNKQSSKINKQSSKVNVRQYDVVNRAVKWMSIVLSDIHLTALFTSLYCLTFILLLCLPHCFVWHSFYWSAYSIVL